MSIKAVFKNIKNAGYIVNPVEKYLNSIAEVDNDRALNVNAPSSVGGCLRARYYSRVGEDRDSGNISPRVRRIFDNGSHFHERMQGYMYKAGVLLLDEIPVLNEEYNIQGHTDGLAKLPDRRITVVELKSINEKGFKELKVPKSDHVEQAMTYMYSLEERRLFIKKTWGTYLLFYLNH